MTNTNFSLVLLGSIFAVTGVVTAIVFAATIVSCGFVGRSASS